ncbi:MAG TPA: hypothetical protein VEU72_05355 [Nitrosopumilaceae archaeon]|nr:hypothetical protein [Nitrosopumilaceae archaeon]
MKHHNTIFGKEMRDRKGISTVIGSVFFIIIFTSIASYVIYSMNQIDQFGVAVIGKGQDNINRNNEAFEITGVTKDNNKFNITIQNTGQLPVNITRLWIQNKTDPTWPTTKFTINQIVAPGQTLTKIGENLQLTAKPSQAYDISLVTERGNTKEFLVNSASQKPLYLQLFVLPDKISTGFDTTILFAVTNNMSNNGILTNLAPNLSIATPIGATTTMISGPEPSTYPILQKGDTAYFKWVYNISGNSGQGINFTASLQNGYLGNSVSRNATITQIQGLPIIKTIMGGGLNGTISSTSLNYLRFFGDSKPSSTYNLKSIIMPINGTFKDLYVNKGTGTGTATLTLYKNGVSSGVTCTTGTSCPDKTHSVSVIAGDTVAMAIQFSNLLPNGDVTFTVEFDPT